MNMGLVLLIYTSAFLHINKSHLHICTNNYLRCMSFAPAQKRIQALAAELKQHNYNYYVLAMPTISDHDFDMKLDELSSLEKQFPEFADPDSPTQKVGGDITKEFVTVKHRWPML